MQTQTPRADTCTPAAVQAAVKKALTSAAFGQFMTGVVLNAVAEAAARPQGIVLAEPQPSRVRWRENLNGGFRSYEVRDAEGRELFTMQASCFPSTHTPAGVWYGSQTRWDETGRAWESDLGHRVIDDFGDLVEVAE